MGTTLRRDETLYCCGVLYNGVDHFILVVHTLLRCLRDKCEHQDGVIHDFSAGKLMYSLQRCTAVQTLLLEALQKAQNMGVSSEELRPFILQTLTNLYSSTDAALKQLGHTGEKMKEAEGAFGEVRRRLEMDCSSGGTTQSTSDGNGCAAGDLCLESCFVEITDDDEKCSVSNRRAHNVCIAVDDHKSACLKCFGFDEA